MKKIFLTLITFINFQIVFHANAQIVSKDYDTPVFQAFMKGKSYAVLTNDEEFNNWFKPMLEKVWTCSEISFITAAELDSFVKSDKNFFLFPQAKDDKTAAVHLLNSDDITKKKEFFMVLSQGGYKQTKLLFTPALTGTKIIGSFRFSPDRAALTSGMFECEMLVALINQSIQTIIDHQIKNEVKDSVKIVISDEMASQIADKTLLINQAYNDGSISLEDKPIINDKVLADYPYESQLVTKDEIESLVSDGAGNYCYLFFYFPSQYLKTTDDGGDILVYDSAQRKFLYFEDNMDGPWFEKYKMKDMIYAIKSK